MIISFKKFIKSIFKNKIIKFKYYKSEFDGDINIYRIPDNGKSFLESINLIERYFGNNKWSKKYTKGIVDDSMTGYFSPDEDEITEKTVVNLMKKIDNKLE